MCAYPVIMRPLFMAVREIYMKKYFLSALVIMSLLLTCVVALPTEVLADPAPVNYLDLDGVVKPVTATVIQDDTATMTDTLTDGWYVVNSDVTRTGTITVSGNVKLILVDGKKLTVTGSDANAGINVTDTNSLTIYGQTGGTGVLNATGGSRIGAGPSGTGIGGGIRETGGNITIIGGVVEATGGFGSAGIGGGYQGAGGVITISGGTVNATGVNNGAGIGGGMTGSGGKINISGGSVKATGGWAGAGIGGGEQGSGGEITIGGGEVEATGGHYGAGIGGGNKGNGGTVELTGGVVFALGGTNAKDVGAGPSSTSDGSLDISGTTALFLRKDNSVTPTTDHKHEEFTNHTSGNLVYGIPVEWAGNFGAWLPIFTITFNSAEGSPVEPITQYTGTAITVPSNPTRVGYTFAAWDPALPETMPAENKTITAQWTINSYTITFNTDGGSDVDAITQDYGTAITAPADPTRDGYTFDGWLPDVPGTMPADNMTITAQWTINSYTITFVSNGGSEVADITQDYGTDIIAPDNPTREGYTFSRWDPDIPEIMPAEDMTITAQWTINSYTITFNTDGGSDVDAITQDYGTDIIAPDNPTRDGHTFNGWNPTIPRTMPAEDMTITALWTINQYTITFENEDGTTLEEQTVAYGVTPEYAGTTPTKDATAEFTYTFDKWTPEVSAVTGDATYTATYTAQTNSYTITFNSDGGSAVNPITQNYGTAITVPTDPTREGYTFNGWLPDMPKTMPAEDMTLKAQWTVKSYRVVFLNWDGTPLSTETVPYGGAATPPAAPTREGYTFTGWGQDYDDITEELVLSAQFTKSAPATGENNIYLASGITLLLVAAGLGAYLKRRRTKEDTAI